MLSKSLMIVMSAIDNGVTLKDIYSKTGMTYGAIIKAVKYLEELNLIESRMWAKNRIILISNEFKELKKMLIGYVRKIEEIEGEKFANKL